MRWCCGASSIEPAEPLTAEQLAEEKNEAVPPLTVEQLAEKQEEAELIAAQLAEPSKWDEVGPNKPNASALNSNQIGDDGVAALASALRGGALPACREIYLRGNPGSDAPVREALRSPERAAALAQRQAE